MDKTLMKSYLNLNNLQKRILQIIALTYQVEDNSYFYYYSNSDYIGSLLIKKLLEYLTEEFKLLSNKELVDNIKTLRKNNFLSKYNKLMPELLYPISTMACNKENFDYVIPIVLKLKGHSLTLNFDSYYSTLQLHDPHYFIGTYNLCTLNFLIHTNDISIFNNQLTNDAQIKLILGYKFLFFDIDIDQDWFKTRHKIFQSILCVIKLMHDIGFDLPIVHDRSYWFSNFLSLDRNTEFKNLPILNAYLNQLQITCGNFSDIKKQNYTNQWAKLFVDGTELIMSDNNKGAIKKFEASIKEFNNLFGRREYWFWCLEASILYMIALIKDKKYDKIESTILSKFKNSSYEMNSEYKCAILGILNILRNDITIANLHYQKCEDIYNKIRDDYLSQDLLIAALCSWLMSLTSTTKFNKNVLKKCLKLSVENNKVLASYIFSEVIIRHDINDKVSLLILSVSPYQALKLNELIQTKNEWEYKLDQMTDLLISKNNNIIETVNTKKIIWLLDPINFKLKAHEENIRKNGERVIGKEISISKMYKKIDLGYIDHKDSLVMNTIKQDFYDNRYYYWDMEKAIEALIDHPNIFFYDDPEKKLELILEYPSLSITTVNDGFSLKISHLATSGIQVEQLSSTKYKVIKFSNDILQLAEIIKQGITIPMEAKPRILEIISKNPAIKINADISDENIEIIDAISSCIAQLTPNNDGLTLNILIKPFGEKSNYYHPGSGINSMILPNKNNKIVKMVRNFDKENLFVESLIKNCPILDINRTNNFEWDFEEINDALQLLSELHEYKKQYQLDIEWPKGESIKFKTNINDKNLSIKINSKQNWFEYEGSVEIEDSNLSLQTLLTLLDTNENRFVQLEDGKFIALTDSFKKRLIELKLLSEGNKVFHLRSNVLNELANNASDAQLDKKWKEHITKIKQFDEFNPQVPKTLQVELRDYQIDGFKYLSRLLNWQIGACLADDMGLGKTVQAIAILVEYAKNGASLIIAPTSVCFNWIDEIQKFAPSLNVYLLHKEQDREVTIKQLKEFDVLICSYNLLQYTNNILERDWNLVVLDEAQAIKNSNTKRFKTACQINSKYRIALSGTPIENHLGELWSLFRFLNPGLLGSLDNFQKKFINPITNNNKIAKTTLKNLVAPFILRRTKSQVLNELPPKTEQAIYIEPSKEEVTFYQAVRQKALKNINNITDKENKRFSILAEITKLRQACCHSSLIDPKIKIENSKLNTFLELVVELIENNHKTLVFSQYVGYLEIVKQVLTKHNINFQYIDGSTPIAKRKQAVTNFQNGDGDLFLISLKAGGTGLNLTVADYVIILDPWWNPAVEDQAADRAHRMGQQRPVTVYRLIMKNSIEEKIIQLHKDKRDLAGDLLSGQDIGSKLSESDLINLITI